MALLDVTDGWYRVMSLDDLVERVGWRVSRLERYGVSYKKHLSVLVSARLAYSLFTTQRFLTMTLAGHPNAFLLSNFNTLVLR